MSQTNNTDTAEEMSLAIELWQESGLSQKSWYKQEGIPLGKFEYWKSKLSKQAKSDSSFIPVEVVSILPTPSCKARQVGLPLAHESNQ